jgi:hypothetical protein
VGGAVAPRFAASARQWDRAIVARLSLPADARGRAFAEEVAAAQLDVPAMLDEATRESVADALFGGSSKIHGWRHAQLFRRHGSSRTG